MSKKFTESWLYDSLAQLSEKNMIGFILKILEIVYPILAVAGLYLEGPIAVHLMDGFTESTIKYLLGYEMAKISLLGDTPKKFEKSLERPEFGLLMAQFSDSRFTGENIARLKGFCDQQRVNGEVVPLVLLLADSAIPYRYLEGMSGSLYLEKTVGYSDEFERGCYETAVRYQDMIRVKAADIAKTAESELAIFDAVREFVVLLMDVGSANSECKSRVLTLYEEAFSTIESGWLLSSGDNGRALTGFVHNLQQYALDGEVHIQERGGVLDDVSRLDETLLYDEENYFLTNQVFRDLCEPMAGCIGEDYMRELLVDKGILKSEGCSRRYFTTKIRIRTKNDTVPRRFVRLNRRVVDAEFEFSLIEQAQIKGDDLYEF